MFVAVPPPESTYIFPSVSIPPQPLPWIVSRSYSATIRIGVARLSTTKSPPPRSVTNVSRLVESMSGQIGALSGRSTGSCRSAPVGVVPFARSSVAPDSSVNVFVA